MHSGSRFRKMKSELDTERCVEEKTEKESKKASTYSSRSQVGRLGSGRHTYISIRHRRRSFLHVYIRGRTLLSRSTFGLGSPTGTLLE